MIEKAIYAGGCFWGVEFYLRRQPGVIRVTAGYTGGWVENPSYEEVKEQTTGHAEAVMVEYDPLQVSYETLTKLFLEIHDPTQVNRQGVDCGTQYRSEIFYLSENQKVIAQELLEVLRSKGMSIATGVTPAGTFWEAENYHQDYCNKTQTRPECHRRVKRF